MESPKRVIFSAYGANLVAVIIQEKPSLIFLVQDGISITVLGVNNGGKQTARVTEDLTWLGLIILVYT